MLTTLQQFTPLQTCIIFALGNFLITIVLIIVGMILQNLIDKKYKSTHSFTRKQVTVCIITNILNILITVAGYELWRNGWIILNEHISLEILWDFLFLFFAMDLLLYIFHWGIHKTKLYDIIHQLHHTAEDPSPIDLFVLHPLETISFGSIWVILIMLFPFNIYALAIYITVNVIFGLVGHLGVEPFSEKITCLPIIKYIGTSTFHHDHHLDVHYNFGFYTNLWDRLFGTYKKTD